MKGYLFCLLIISTIFVNAQIQMPVKFLYQVTKQGKNKYEVAIKIKLEPHWHIYSQQAGDGPVSTKFSFDKNPLISFLGTVSEHGKLQKKYDNAFRTTLQFYDDEVNFKQVISLQAKIKTQLSGNVYYMVCDEKRCLPPTKEKFTIAIP